MKIPSDELSTHQKALALNLDRKIYGTIAEIGAGQEVARWLFRVGAAAGSIAKTMSAYDMKVSDEVYGKVGRYVSRERVTAMLDKEYHLLCQRLGDERQNGTRFFAFADTVSARNYAGDNDCHGWIGLRFQTTPGGAPNDLILHVNMLDRTNLRQQEALGVLGINLIYAAFHTDRFTVDFLHELLADLPPGRVTIDLICTAGPALTDLNDLEIGLTLVKHDMTEAVLFGPNGRFETPNEVIRKRRVIIERGLYRAPTEIKPETLAAAIRQLQDEAPDDPSVPLALLELSVKNLREKSDIGDAEHLQRLGYMMTSGHRILLTRLTRNYCLTDYLRRYSQESMRFSMSVSMLAMLFNEEFYAHLPGGLLEATGKLFANNVKVYAHEMSLDAFNSHIDSSVIDAGYVVADTDGAVSIDDIIFRGPLNLLYRHILDTGWIVALR